MRRFPPLLLLAIAIATQAVGADLLCFDSPPTEVQEDIGTVTMLVGRSGTGVGAASVDYATSGGLPGVRYTATNGTLHWASGDLAPNPITITVIHDGVYDGDVLPMHVDLGNSIGATLPNAGAYYAPLTIDEIDPDPTGTLQIVSTMIRPPPAGSASPARRPASSRAASRTCWCRARAAQLAR